MIFDPKKLCDFRKSRKMSVAKLSSSIGILSKGSVTISVERINSLEKGKKNTVSPMEFGYICMALEVEPNDLYIINKEVSVN